MQFVHNVKRYCRFSLREVEELIGIAFVFAFGLSFTDWGVESFDYLIGVSNLLTAFLVVAVSLFFHTFLKKLYAIWRGYTITHRTWTAGILGSAIITLLTNGRLPLFFSSSFDVQTTAMRRLGRKHGVHMGAVARIAIAGMFATSLLAAVAQWIAMVWPGYVVQKLLTFNALYLLYNILPLPQIDGSKIFFASRLLYTFIVVSVLAFVLMALAGASSFILAGGLGLIATIIFWFFYEKDWS
ncbi:hypothetical protein GF342_01820 [Candidatus Woesearchaeota archaeon]|nr:hypothetical protein [Candidatus Woesearchaeota archaeon]